jgi:hypothetical protein
VILRPEEQNEVAAYMILQGTRIGERMPIFYGIHENMIMVEDIGGEFASPSIIDFKLSPTSGVGGLKCMGGYICKNGVISRRWERSVVSNFSTAQIRDVYNEFVPKELAGQIAGMIRDIKRAYENEVKETPGFRIRGTSLLIAYDGDDLKKTPRVVLNGFKHLRLDIIQEGLQANDCPDGFLDGINEVLGLAREDSGTAESKCCLLL